MEDVIKMKDKNSERFDKKQIALAIRNAGLEDELGCSLIEEGIVKCEDCSLRDICNGIDELSEEYISSTSKVLKQFDFN